MSPQSHYQQETIKNYQNVLVKHLKDQCTGMKIKQKVRVKLRQLSINFLSNQTIEE